MRPREPAAARRSRAFPREARLLKARDFARVFEAPRREGDRFFTVLARPSPVGTARLGLAISRRQLRRAVDRNRIKRLVREHFRNEVVTGPPLDYVVMVRAAARDADSARLRAALARLFARAARACEGGE